ncbi:MAG: RimK family alpha-L-glutamate ligase [Methanosarcinales archaeon]|nr:RimK family alpha-L-glutamate ligase [Methanosarcinales archaeon]
MRMGIVVSDPEDWTARAIHRGLHDQGLEVVALNFSDLAARIGPGLAFGKGEVLISDLDGLVVRDMGRGAAQDVAFRFETLHALKEMGKTVVNPPQAILRAANKFATSVALQRAGIPTPRTTVTSSLEEAARAVREYGRAVSKPLFGYKGKDLHLLSEGEDAALAELIRRNGLVYLQEFVPLEQPRDIRAFVVEDRVAGAIYRVAPPGSWISNLARGGGARPCPLTRELEDLAVRANRAVGSLYSGVDLLETPEGLKVIEVNGTPSGKGIFTAHGIDVGAMIAGRVKALL